MTDNPPPPRRVAAQLPPSYWIEQIRADLARRRETDTRETEPETTGDDHA